MGGWVLAGQCSSCRGEECSCYIPRARQLLHCTLSRSTVARDALTYHFHTDGNGYIMLQQRKGAPEQWAPPIACE